MTSPHASASRSGHSYSRPSRRITRIAPPPLPQERSGAFVQAITIDQEIWQAFGESEEAIQSALRKLVAEMRKKKKSKGAPNLLDLAWKALFTPAKAKPRRASKKKAKRPRKRA
jgi:hypothetical protein